MGNLLKTPGLEAQPWAGIRELRWSSKSHALSLSFLQSTALHKMMPDDFFDGGGGLDPAEWLVYIEENKKNGSWRDLQRSFTRGTVVDEEWTRKGFPARITRDKGYYFEFRKDRRWYFAGIVSH